MPRVAVLPVAPVVPQKKLAAQGDVIRDCEACPELVVVAEGSFMMGQGDEGDADASDLTPPREFRFTTTYSF